MVTVEIPDTADVIQIDMINYASVLVITNEEDFNWLLETFKDDSYTDNIKDDWQDASGACYKLHKDGIPFFILTIINNTERVIVHECVHMMHFITEYRGIPSDSTNTEVCAYLTDYLYSSVKEIIRKKECECDYII